MLAENLKTSIDRIWNVFWSNGMTNPLTVMEQITFLLFMKRLDDIQTKIEAKASRFGGVAILDPVFTKKDEPLRWRYFHNLAPEQMLEHVTTKVFPFVTALGSGRRTAFSRYMADAQFQIISAKVLSVAVAEIDQMHISEGDVMGDVYEELLDKVKSSGENGQFRSPTHIIDMMVELIEPTLEDTFCDPAFGTAGFLVAVAKYLLLHFPRELMEKKARQHFKSSMFRGYDIDKQMLRIGAMNLMLHGVDDPDVRYNNSIAEDSETPRGECTVALANPPFAGNMTEIEIAKDLLSISKTRKTELLFVTLFTKLLKIGGRCAAIVPQGVLFGSSTAHVNVRRELVDHQQLDAVISMPSGVFKPYAGVATAIILFHKTDNGGTKDVLFYDMKADGFSLDDKREPVKENDIPDVIAKWKAWKKGRSAAEFTDRKAQCFAVPREEIAANGYDLSFNKYKEVEYVAEKFPPTGEILADIRGSLKELDKLVKELEVA